MDHQLNCPICSQKYTRDNIPRLIPKCGHTFCQNCIQHLMDQSAGDSQTPITVVCPEDKQQITLEENDINSFPKNFALIKLLNSTATLGDKQPGVQHKNTSSSTSNDISQIEKKGLLKNIDVAITTMAAPGSSNNKSGTDSFKDASLDQSNIAKVSLLDNADEEDNELITALGQSTKGTEGLQPLEDVGSPTGISTNAPNKIVDLEDICLVHQKPLQIICIKDLTRICSTCAIFGQHKGHEFKSTDQVHKDMKQREECILVLMDIHSTLTQKISGKDAKDEISRQLALKKQALSKEIKHKYTKLSEMLKASEKRALEKLTSTFVSVEDKIKEECKLPQQIASRYRKWEDKAYNQIKSFDAHNNFEEQLKLLNYDKKSGEEDILQTGEMIIGMIEKSGASILEAREQALKSIILEFKIELDMKIPDYVSVVVKDKKKTSGSFITTASINNDKKEDLDVHRRASSHLNPPQFTQSVSQNDDDLLLDQGRAYDHLHPINEVKQASPVIEESVSRPVLAQPPRLPPCRSYSTLHNTLTISTSPNDMLPTIPMHEAMTTRDKRDHQYQNLKTLPSQPETTRHSKLEESRNIKSSFKDNSFTLQTTNSRVTMNGGLGVTGAPKKKPKIKLPEKIDKLFDSIIADQVENADFTGAELGDAVTLQVVEYIKGKKVRNLKLIRNKLTDEAVEKMFCCFGNIITLNLSQNMLTDRFVDLVLANVNKMPLLKNLVLSQNKIKERNVKARVEEIKKYDINVSL